MIGFTTHGVPMSVDRRAKFFLGSRKAIRRALQPQFLRGEPADAFAVHRELRRARCRHDLEAFRLEFHQHVRGDRLHLRHDQMRLLFPQHRRSASASSMENTCDRCATCIAGAFA